MEVIRRQRGAHQTENTQRPCQQEEHPQTWLLIRLSTLAPINILVLISFIQQQSQQKCSMVVKNNRTLPSILLNKVFPKGRTRS